MSFHHARFHHARSEKYASIAESWSQKDPEIFKTLYELAAIAEEHALLHVPPNKPRALGVIGVSAVSLYLKAKNYDRAKSVADRLLKSESLPNFAISQLQEVVQSMEVFDD